MNLLFKDITNEKNIKKLKILFEKEYNSKNFFALFINNEDNYAEYFIIIMLVSVAIAFSNPFIFMNIDDMGLFGLNLFFNFIGMATLLSSLILWQERFKNKINKFTEKTRKLFSKNILLNKNSISEINHKISTLNDTEIEIINQLYQIRSNPFKYEEKDIIQILFYEKLKNCSIEEIRENKSFILNFIKNNSINENWHESSLKRLEERLKERTLNERYSDIEKEIDSIETSSFKEKMIKNI